MNNFINITKLSKSFSQGKNKLNILNNVNLSIESGDNIALVGPSGCGKSTFLQIIGLLDKADSGSINYLSNDYAKISDKKRTLFRRKHIGFIYQFHYLLPEFSAEENTMLPLIINGISPKKAKIASQKLLTSLGLSDRLQHKPNSLSGGEQQRIAIARALIHQPTILLADEPTGNLDPENANNVFELFFNEIKKRNQTTIVVTHNIELAKKFNKVITIKNGQIENF